MEGPVMETATSLRIQRAYLAGRFFLHSHCLRRRRQRRVDWFDIKRAIQTASRVEPYKPKRPLPRGTSAWRIHGRDLQGKPISVGVNLTEDHLGTFVLVATVF